MSEIKYQYDHNKIYVVCELCKEETVTMTDLEQIQERYHKLLLFPIKESIKEHIVRYDVSNRTSFSQYVQNYIDEFEFLKLIELIAKSILALDQSENLLSKVCLNPEFMFVDGTENCQFLLLPIQSLEDSMRPNEIIKEFILTAHIIPNSNTGIQQFLINYLNFQSVFQLPIFITMLQNMSTRYARSRSISSSFYQKTSEIAPSTAKQGDNACNIQRKECTKQPTIREDIYIPVEDENATILLTPQSNETVPLRQLQSICRAYINRIRTKERVEVTKPVFRIGKEAIYVDYYVEGNPAVSRCHAMVIRRGNRFFVRDTNSTNHTFVDDVMLRKNEEKEVESGSKVILADEEFYFEIV